MSQMLMNKQQLEAMIEWHDKCAASLRQVLPGCQSCRNMNGSLYCSMHEAKPPKEVFLMHGCDDWSHQVGLPLVKWKEEQQKKGCTADFDDMDDMIPF